MLFVAIPQIIQRRSCGQNQQVVRLDEFEMLLAELLVLFGIKRRVEENVPVFVSEFCQGSGQLRESRAITDLRRLRDLAGAQRHRIREAMIKFRRFQFCYEKVTRPEAKLKGEEFKIG